MKNKEDYIITSAWVECKLTVQYHFLDFWSLFSVL